MPQIKIFVPILVIESTNPDWLAELKAQLAAMPIFQVQEFEGAPSMDEVPARRFEILKDHVPAECTHVMFVDPDDLISPAGMEHAIAQLRVPGIKGVLLKEHEFKDGFSIFKGRPHYCCRAIVEKEFNFQVAKRTLAQGLLDKAHASKLLGTRRVVPSSKVCYYWRRHDGQSNK